MAARPQPRWWAPRGSTIGLFAVAVIVGVLFASNAALFRGADESRPTDLAGLVREGNERVAALEAEIVQLRSERDSLLDESHGNVPAPSPDLVTAGAGTALEGRGVRARMWDAPSIQPEDSPFDVNDLVVHQQDLEGVINALWAGGAEAVSVQGERLTATSAVRCIGNVLLLHGRQYSPPYVIEAIGDPDELRAALDASPAVQVYLQYVDAVGLGWELTTMSRVTIPAATEVGGFGYVQVL